MKNSSEQLDPYLEERAMKEAFKMKGKIEFGEAKDYNEAEKIIENEKIEREQKNLLEEKERMEKDKQFRLENYKKYGRYNDYVYKIISELFLEKGLGSASKRAWMKKINRFHQIPPEARFIFEKLKEENISVNDISPQLLKDVLGRAFDLVDRKDDYDKDLAHKIGYMELLRWRNNEELQNGDSFKKIVATLREHAVIKVPKTKIGQKPKVTFQPKGDYHKNDNL